MVEPLGHDYQSVSPNLDAKNLLQLIFAIELIVEYRPQLFLEASTIQPYSSIEVKCCSKPVHIADQHKGSRLLPPPAPPMKEELWHHPTSEDAVAEESSHIHGNTLDPLNSNHTKINSLHVHPAAHLDLSEPLETLCRGPWHDCDLPRASHETKIAQRIHGYGWRVPRGAGCQDQGAVGAAGHQEEGQC